MKTVHYEGYALCVEEGDALGVGHEQNGFNYECEVTGALAHYINSSTVFVDVGAGYGHYMLVAKAVARGCTYLGVDPRLSHVQCITATIQKNQFDKAGVVYGAAWSETGVVNLVTQGLPESGLTHVGKGGDTFVPAFKLDDLVARVDLMKIDTEGAESHVLRGMPRLLRECRPTIVFEFNPVMSARTTFWPTIWSTLSRAGYTIHSLPDMKQILDVPTIVASNYLAVCT